MATALDSEQIDELTSLKKSLDVLCHLREFGNSPGDDAAIQIAVLLTLATRVQRLNYQLDNVIDAMHRIGRS